MALVLAPWAAGSAYADSDGYYCIGPGYLAYQFGFAAPSERPHRLYMVRIGGPAVISEPVVLELPQFQVHGMECAERRIRLASFDAVYTVPLDANREPASVLVAPLAERGRWPAEFTGRQQNLGEWSKAVGTLSVERILLKTNPTGHAIVLEITPTASTERCVTDISTRVIELDATGRVLRERALFQGKGRRECGGHEHADIASRRPSGHLGRRGDTHR
jgi:hypothetical protein